MEREKQSKDPLQQTEKTVMNTANLVIGAGVTLGVLGGTLGIIHGML